MSAVVVMSTVVVSAIFIFQLYPPQKIDLQNKVEQTEPSKSLLPGHSLKLRYHQAFYL